MHAPEPLLFGRGALFNVQNIGCQISSIITNSAFITNSYAFLSATPQKRAMFETVHRGNV